MSANVDQNTRPDYDQVLQDIADGGRRWSHPSQRRMGGEEGYHEP